MAQDDAGITAGPPAPVGLLDQHFRILFEESEDATMVSRLDGTILDCNPSALRLFGVPSREVFLATPASTYYCDPGDRVWYMEIFRRQGHLRNEVVRYKSLEGQTFWGLASGKILHFPDGEQRLITWVRDITRRVQAEDELRLHAELFQNISEAVYLVRLDGQIVYTTPHFETMFGYGPGELIGKHVSTLNAAVGQDPLAVAAEITRRLKEAGFWEGEVYNRRKDGAIFLSHARVTLFDHSHFGRVAINIHSDITARKQAEDLIVRQNVALKALGADKDRLLSILAHDLRGAFQHITGYADLLMARSGSELPAAITEPLGHISKTAWQANQVFEDLLLWARSGSGLLAFEPRNLRLGEICKAAIDAARPEAEAKNIRLDDLEGPDLELSVDPRMMRVVLRNLLANALKFTWAGGVVRLTLERLDHHARVTVTDTGVGISEERMRTLGEWAGRNSTLGTAAEKGSGLGLLLCRDFIDKHGGSLHITSREGVGSAFAFTLPLHVPGGVSPASESHL